MKISVQFFSVLQEITGCEHLDHVAGDHHAVRVSDVLEDLYRRFPALHAWDSRLQIAVDLDFAGRDALLRDGQELALMPPFQGG